MEITISLMEKEDSAKKELREISRNHFQYTVKRGSFSPKERFHIEDLVGEINYILRKKDMPEIDLYASRKILEKLTPNGKVYIPIKENR
jgi:hypothetical protein